MNKRPKRNAEQSNYEVEKDMVLQFFRQFEDPNLNHPKFGKSKYFAEIEKTLINKTEIVEVHLEDVEDFFSAEKHKAFLHKVKTNAVRYIKIFTAAAEELKVDSFREMSIKEQIEDEIHMHNLPNFDVEENTDFNSGVNHYSDKNVKKNDSAKRIFQNKFKVILIPGPNAKQKIEKLRDLKAENIGSLVKVKGTVVRVTEVKPKMILATYQCTVCKCDISKTVSAKVFMPPVICESPKCKSMNSRGNIVPIFQNSKFISFQELRIQETSDQSPIGSVPRSFVVHLNGPLVRSCAPGDTIIVDGVFLPMTDDSYNRRDALIHETYIDALKIEREKKSDSDRGPMSQTDIEQFQQLSRSDNIIQLLAKSIAPEIFGMESVKKALLLQMAGGSTISTGDGLRIRGDLNIALIGDPGVAKSQLLKHVAHLSPRGIYTTGKGSSGAGLTACVTRDSNTGEISLEGGALVLSDLGICCIDEFDKMQDNDRVAIHEVMEQQTISLAKAGITTSLNARASILAAANPVFGRYDRNKSPHENIGLPYSLLSRFDLVYILLDKSNEVDDLKIARHIASLHQKNRISRDSQENISPRMLQEYVSYARTIHPTLQEHLHQYIIRKYVEKRKSNKDLGKFGQYITPRSLLAVIRFAIACAKLRLSPNVEQVDIDTVMELMEVSQGSVLTEEEEGRHKFTGKIKNTETKQIHTVIRDSLNGMKKDWIEMNVLGKSCLHLGISKEQLMKYINEHIDLGFYILENDNTILRKVTMI